MSNAVRELFSTVIADRLRALQSRGLLRGPDGSILGSRDLIVSSTTAA